MLADANDVLKPESATTYRALSARYNYIAQDRPDISFAAKELCRDFAAPTIRSWARLKRVVRYLRRAPRLVYFYPWQPRQAHLSVFVDTDFAGCRVTRRSTSGGLAMHGDHCIRHWSSTKTTLAMSSGEAELGGLCKGGAHGLGLRSVAADLGFAWSLKMFTDATAAMGMSRRLGIGKIRHLDVSLLWIQDKVRTGEIDLQKVLGKDHPADALTKHLPGPQLQEHLKRMNITFETGSASTAPQLP